MFVSALARFVYVVHVRMNTRVLRMDLAQLMNLNVVIPSHAAALDKMKESLGGGDMLWDDKVPHEKLCKDAGLLRFPLQKKLLQVDKEIESTHEEVTNTTSNKGGNLTLNLKLLTAGSSCDDGVITVKVESQALIKLREDIKVIKSGELKLAAIVKELKLQLAGVECLEEKGWACQACLLIDTLQQHDLPGEEKAAQLRTAIEVAEKVQTECIKMIVGSEKLKGDMKEAIAEMAKDLEALQDRAVDTWEAGKVLKKKIKAFLDGA